MQTGTNFSESFQAIYEDDTSFLEKTVTDYPASPLSLFLLLQDYKRTGDPRFSNLAKKASIYFQNPAWINYQLSGDELMKGVQEDHPSEKGEVTNSRETEDEIQPADTEEYLQQENEIENVIEQEAIQEMEQEEKVEFVQGEEITDFEESFLENETNDENILEDEDILEDAPVEEEGPSIEDKIEEDHLEENELAEPKENDPEIDTQDQSSPVADIDPDLEKSDIGVSVDEESEETTMTDEKEHLPKTTTPPSETRDQKREESQELEFEPLHTIDYFASQGIIIREEALMDDKLGKQVKSFTDWLKSMKKIHPGRLPEQNEVVERIIQSSAELSNEDAGILTESMAEVLLKQGKKGKAIEMFEKLSLMNPSKSIYFAAKIESLKNK